MFWPDAGFIDWSKHGGILRSWMKGGLYKWIRYIEGTVDFDRGMLWALNYEELNLRQLLIMFNNL
jgi:hypothetical protein